MLSRDTSLLYSTIEWSDFERKNGHLASCAELFFEMLLLTWRRPNARNFRN